MISVLYADDESLLLDVTKTYLDRTGEFCVTTANSGPSALDLLATTQFDAVISDYQMPVMDGIELLKHVRAASPNLPFIMFTGNQAKLTANLIVRTSCRHGVGPGNLVMLSAPNKRTCTTGNAIDSFTGKLEIGCIGATGIASVRTFG